MKKHRRLKILFSLLITFLLLVFININYDILKQNKKVKDYLFNTTDFKLEKICYEDFNGLSMDGSFFYFYKYKIEGLKESNLKGNYPNFEKLFKVSELEHIEFSYWNQTPISRRLNKYYFNIVNFLNISHNNCSKKIQEQDYLNKSGNYYSFISSYEIGTHLYIYIPNSKELFIISKR